MQFLETLLRTVLLIVLLALSAQIIISILKWDFYRALTPEKIGLGWYFTHAATGVGHCGAVFYGLDNPTLKKIQQQGLDFFKDAGKSRRLYRKHSYLKGHHKQLDEWKIVSPSIFSEGPPFGLSCARKRGLEDARKVIKALQRSGGYTSLIDGIQLYVVPSKGMIVFSHFD